MGFVRFLTGGSVGGLGREPGLQAQTPGRTGHSRAGHMHITPKVLRSQRSSNAALSGGPQEHAASAVLRTSVCVTFPRYDG
jgi:hypothetical protein